MSRRFFFINKNCCTPWQQGKEHLNPMYIITPSNQVFFTHNLVRIWKSKCTSTGQTGNLYANKANCFGIFASDGTTTYPVFLTHNENAADTALNLIIDNLENDKVYLNFKKPFRMNLNKSEATTDVPQIAAPPRTPEPKYFIYVDAGHLEEITEIVCKRHCLTIRVYRDDYHTAGHPAVWTIVPEVSGLSDADADHIFHEVMAEAESRGFWIHIESAGTGENRSCQSLFEHNPIKTVSPLRHILSSFL